MKKLPLGPLMIDVAGTALCDLDCERLCHPLVGGIILFARNYDNSEQLSALCAEVHALRQPPLPIAIDHEGGRVQRCRDAVSYTHLDVYKRQLQEWLQSRKKPLPRYVLQETTGAAHEQHFQVACELDGLDMRTLGTGTSRRLAEQAAADNALQVLEK